MRFQVVASVIVFVCIGAFVAHAALMNTAKIVVDSPERAFAVVLALYPDGFKSVGKFEVSKGRTEIPVNLAKLRKAWEEERRKNGTFADPFLMLVAVSKGKIAVSSVSFSWDSPKKAVTLKFKPAASLSKLDPDIQPLDDLMWVVEDTYEYTLPVIFAYVHPGSSSWGVINYFYAKGSRVGFSVNVFVNSWTVTGYNFIRKYEAKGVFSPFDSGQEYYVWMDVKYRYEKVVIYLDDEPISTMEFVYVVDFYPSTMSGGTSKPANAQLVEIDGWDYKGIHSSSSSTYPYYTFDTYDLQTDRFAIDCLKFIQILTTVGKISGRAAAAANAIGLFTGVDFEYDDIEAFYFSIALYSNHDTMHEVWIAESEAVAELPAIYVWAS